MHAFGYACLMMLGVYVLVGIIAGGQRLLHHGIGRYHQRINGVDEVAVWMIQGGAALMMVGAACVVAAWLQLSEIFEWALASQ